MKKIAVITGASSGMGRRFAETVDTFGRFDEVWVIARHEKALEELRDRVPYPIRPLALDLTDRRSFRPMPTPWRRSRWRWAFWSTPAASASSGP